MNIDSGELRQLRLGEQPGPREVLLTPEEVKQLSSLPPEERLENLLATNKAIRKARKRAQRQS